MARDDRFSLRPLPQGEAVTINKTIFVGTSQDSDLVLPSGFGSRRHAVIRLEAGGVTLEDNLYTNGTFVNGTRLPRGEKRGLSNGDLIRFARQEFEFHDAGPEQPSMINRDKLDGRQSGGSDTHQVDPDLPGPVDKGPHQKDVSQPCLEIISGMRTGEGVTFRDAGSGRATWPVGSKEVPGMAKEPNFLVLPDEGVSEEHARITYVGGRWTVEDLVSKNGTLVNGKKAMRSYLQSGDEICFGPVHCIFRLPGGKARRGQDETRIDVRRLIPGRWSALAGWLRRLVGRRSLDS